MLVPVRNEVAHVAMCTRGQCPSDTIYPCLPMAMPFSQLSQITGMLEGPLVTLAQLEALSTELEQERRAAALHEQLAAQLTAQLVSETYVVSRAAGLACWLACRGCGGRCSAT